MKTIKQLTNNLEQAIYSNNGKVEDDLYKQLLARGVQRMPNDEYFYYEDEEKKEVETKKKN